MQCSKCNEKIVLNHKPGHFLAVAVFFLLVLLVGLFTGAAALVLASGLIILFSLGGVSTEMTDASAYVFADHRRKGVYCKSCKHINKIWPWST